jgi:hypothetical protein
MKWLIVCVCLWVAALAVAQTPAGGGGAASSRAATTTMDAAQSDLAGYLQRHAALKAGDVPGRLDLARWCRDREMWGQVAEVSREVLAIDPDNRIAYQYQKLVDVNVPLFHDEKQEAKLVEEFQKRFGRVFQVYYTRHFLILHDTPRDFAASRGTALEKAYDAFMFFFNMKVLRPQFLQAPLVVVLFKERDDYLAYAKQTEGADLGWSAGYYSQRTNRSAFYDDSTGPSAEHAEQQIDRLRQLLKDLNAQINEANQHGKRSLANQLAAERNRAAQAIFQLSNRVDNAVGIINNVKTLHEAAHQLAFNTGVQKRLVDYPLWFSEGLACCFEAEDHNGNRGPAVLNSGRIGVLKKALAEEKLIPLEDFIAQQTPEAMDEKTLSVWYAQGWALFHYMYKFHRPELEKYLLAYQAEPAVREIMPERRKKLFTDAFGADLALLEKQFLAYLKELPGKPAG